MQASEISEFFKTTILKNIRAQVLFVFFLNIIAIKISTSNHMFGRAIRDKLPEYIFKNFHIARVKRVQFQNF